MYVYMLRCADGSLYTGYTTDVQRRFAEHCSGIGAKYTNSHPPVAVTAVWRVCNLSDALRLEYRIKSLSKTKKEQLLVNTNESELFGITVERIQ